MRFFRCCWPRSAPSHQGRGDHDPGDATSQDHGGHAPARRSRARGFDRAHDPRRSRRRVRGGADLRGPACGARPEAGIIRGMAAQEAEHLETFARLMRERGVRPTALSPIWHVAGYALGMATALLGPKAAMAATEAVDVVIVER